MSRFTPASMTEEEVMGDIEHVVEFIAPGFTFGYYDIEDIKQEARMECLKLLDKGKYDTSRQLRNYLYRHLQYRLINLQRDKQFRNEPPCKLCASGTPCGPEGSHCERYAEWLKRNLLKYSLMNCFHVGAGAREPDKGDSPFSRLEGESISPGDDAAERELQRKLDLCLPPELRGVLLRLKDGVPQSDEAKGRLKRAVKKILSGPCRN